MMTIRFKRLSDAARLPYYAHPGDSGMDVSSVEEVSIEPRAHVTVKTGVAAEIPDGYEIQVRPRSGLSARRGVVASFGTVDSGYRGEIGVTLYNHSDASVKIEVGDRIAQFVAAPVLRVAVDETDTLSETARGANGFGSTGVGSMVRNSPTFGGYLVWLDSKERRWHKRLFARIAKRFFPGILPEMYKLWRMKNKGVL